MFDMHIAVHCLTCGREAPLPAKGTAERVFGSGDVIYLDLNEHCPQCHGTRVRVRVGVELTLDVGVKK